VALSTCQLLKQLGDGLGQRHLGEETWHRDFEARRDKGAKRRLDFRRERPRQPPIDAKGGGRLPGPGGQATGSSSWPPTTPGGLVNSQRGIVIVTRRHGPR
jgi:hypothetical protein